MVLLLHNGFPNTNCNGTEKRGTDTQLIEQRVKR